MIMLGYRRTYLLGALALAVFFGLSFLGVVPWTSLHEDIDIQTGRIRRTRYYVFIICTRQIQNSILTQALPKSTLQKASQWKRVCTFNGFSRYSPHYAYHGAIAQIKTLAQSQSMIHYSDAAKRCVAETVLELWQKGGSYYSACDYVADVQNKSMDLIKRGAKKLEAEDLPSRQSTSAPSTQPVL